MEPIIGLSFVKRSPAHELIDMETGFRYENVERETSGRGMTKDVDHRATGKWAWMTIFESKMISVRGNNFI
ncbi:hypothetical protein AZE42_05754 [Rhizopogon vesiculosus]|uniref:Uncharacterized protein n=1 Tax=Rhizopogon vesiculosus TaxID=180088 RepID=A0A1J8QAJ0_9AGAM|nr:hypothetical protein AZE42_05754 [Rhizopogon vesiculosus]